MTIDSLLSILADGKFHSGRELGEALGISRSAIWKHIRRLEESGLEIYSVKGRGYRVPGGLELLDIDQVWQGVDDAVKQQLGPCDLHLTISSTNELAMQQCQQSNCHGSLIVAEQQTAGRGRRGRPWVSPFAKNLYFSMVWRFQQGVAALEGLSLLIGLSLVKALEKQGLEGVQLKWPNDLLFQGKKLAGILLEMHGEASGQCQVVIGVGVNVDMPMQSGECIDQPWVDVNSISNASISRNQLLAEILNELVQRLQVFEKSGFAELVDEWQSYNVHQDQPVILQVGSELVEGVCKGVDSAGALLLDTGQNVQVYHGGEISIQRTYDTGN